MARDLNRDLSKVLAAHRTMVVAQAMVALAHEAGDRLSGWTTARNAAVKEFDKERVEFVHHWTHHHDEQPLGDALRAVADKFDQQLAELRERHAAELARARDELAQVEALAAEYDQTIKNACAELPDDPPGGYTLREAVRAMRLELERDRVALLVCPECGARR